MVDVIRHDYQEIQIVEDAPVRILSDKDIAAMKLNAITGNGSSIKDFIDVYFLLEQFTLE